ncbi:NADPH-dependent 7-cyano-7-deazaguanine reductase QueF [Candidatus Sororendozoicomonas aggregata]|uniref:NADPH-dependent 7-cyano-7-deazaguanine reductase QueF n=1 Tax=Candidatus Sororendozoicomonas aggregata TaxID=3073239 RepID=UPI002ED317F3
MTEPLDQSPLGKKSAYESQYNPNLLFPVARADKRDELGVDENNLPFYGRDLWYGYEVSWLNLQGRPVVRVAAFTLPCESPNLIESKSFKLYLNSLNQSRFEHDDAVHTLLTRDLSERAGARVIVHLMTIADFEAQGIQPAPGLCLDALPITIDQYHYNPALLQSDHDYRRELLCTHLLKSNCLVTGQPDWGTLVVDYAGEGINHASLLRYVCSFREHHEFHEQCVERVFMDLSRCFDLERLTVYAQYLRRGGLDINPWRSTEDHLPAPLRFIRQ